MVVIAYRPNVWYLMACIQRFDTHLSLVIRFCRYDIRTTYGSYNELRWSSQVSSSKYVKDLKVEFRPTSRQKFAKTR